jgi:hypothetical protein
MPTSLGFHTQWSLVRCNHWAKTFNSFPDLWLEMALSPSGSTPLTPYISYTSTGLVELSSWAQQGLESHMTKTHCLGCWEAQPCSSSRPCLSLRGKVRNLVLFPGEQNSTATSPQKLSYKWASIHRQAGWEGLLMPLRWARLPVQEVAPE